MPMTQNRANDEVADAIPMKKSNPLMIGAIVGAVALIVGVVMLTRGGDKKHAAQSTAASAEADPLANMTPEERRRHIEITRKSLALVAEKEAAEAAKKKAAEEAKKAEEEAKAAAAAPGGGSPASGGATKPKTGGKAAKKSMDDLDKLGSDITGKLK